MGWSFLRISGLFAALFSGAVAAGPALAASQADYTAYAAKNTVLDAMISRNGAVVLTHAIEGGDHVLRGWMAETGLPIGKIEPKKWGEGDFDKVVALSFDGQRVAHVYCKPPTGNAVAGWADCEDLRLYNWSGKTVERNKHPDDDQVPGPACGLQFGPDGRVYLCSRSLWTSGRGADDYGTIKVFDPDLDFVYTITPGFMDIASPDPGVMQIQGFRVGDDGVNLMGWGYGYHSNGGRPMSTSYDPVPRGGQVFWAKLPEPGSGCKGFACIDRKNSFYYLFGYTRPADKEDLEKKRTPLINLYAVIAAAQQANGVVLTQQAGLLDLEEGLEVYQLPGAYDMNTGEKVPAYYDMKIGGGAPPQPPPPLVSGQGNTVFFTSKKGPGWYLPLDKAVKPAVRLQAFGSYLDNGENVLVRDFIPGSGDIRMVTDRRVFRAIGPSEQARSAAELYARALGMLDVGFADAGLEALGTSLRAPGGYWVSGVSPDVYQLVMEYGRPGAPIGPAHQGRLILKLADAYNAMSGPARIGFWYPEGTGNLDPPVVDRLEDGHPLLVAGVQKGDVITSVDGIATPWRGDVGLALDRFGPGETVTIGFDRNGTAFTADTVLQERPFTPAGLALDMWAQYAMQALEYGHPDLAEQASAHLRRFIAAKRADGAFAGSKRYESVPEVIDAAVIAHRQGGEAGYQALLAAGKPEEFAAWLILGYPAAAFPLYADTRKLAYVLGKTEDDFKYITPKEPGPSQPFVDLQGNLVPAGGAAQALPADAPPPVSSGMVGDAPASPSPGGTVLD